MRLLLTKYNIKKNKELIIHTFIGLFIGYFIIHPASMVIYWFQLNTLETKEICTLYVEPTRQPVFFNEDNRTIFFLRIGNNTKPLTTMETVEYLKIRERKKRN